MRRDTWHIAYSTSNFSSLCGLRYTELPALDTPTERHYLSTDAYKAVGHSPDREVCPACALLQLGRSV